MRDIDGVPPRLDHARTSPAVMAERLLRTWNAGAGRITVTFGGDEGDHWDIEQSRHRAPISA